MKNVVVALLCGVLGGGIAATAIRAIKSPTNAELEQRVDGLERKVKILLDAAELRREGSNR